MLRIILDEDGPNQYELEGTDESNITIYVFDNVPDEVVFNYELAVIK